MLKRIFDPMLPLLVMLYLRMSSESQNPRSPQQQRDTIEAMVRRLGYPWHIVKVYTDEAVSGRLVRRRPSFQEMLRDIRLGTIKADAVLVDTFERFGRADEMTSLRQELHRQHGVLILTADTQFADPTSVCGKAQAAFESMRASEANRVKAHDVLRGKRDIARLGRWPGGPPPFGYKLFAVLVDRHGHQEVDHCVLVPDPEAAWIIQKLFELAAIKGMGCTRLARALNEDPEIPAKFKPFYDQTVNYWLKQPMYYGELVWDTHATDMIDDHRVIERNPEDEVIRVPNFCEPLVSREQWDIVQAVRRTRGERAKQAREAKKEDDGKQIRPIAPGLALSYPLSGLVCCGHCKRSMTASSSDYKAKNGHTRRYTTYICPGYIAGVCPNNTRIPESWLQENVIALIRNRFLSPPPEA